MSGCIKLMQRTRKDIDDPGAYCAAIADRIEPGWRKANPIAPHYWPLARRMQVVRQFWHDVDDAIDEYLEEPPSQREWDDLVGEFEGIVDEYDGDDHDVDSAVVHARDRIEGRAGVCRYSAFIPNPRELRFVEPSSEEWRRMWEALGEDPASEDPKTGERWQYMGSVFVRGGSGRSGEWVHQFRHRRHPKTGKREYREIPASGMTRWVKNPRTVRLSTIRKMAQKTRREGKAVAKRFGLPLHEGKAARRELFRRYGLPTQLAWEHWEFLGEDPLRRMFGRSPSLYDGKEIWIPIVKEEVDRAAASAQAGNIELVENPKEQLGIFGPCPTEIEGFQLVSPEGEPVGRVRHQKEEQQQLIPLERPSRERLEELRREELARRRAKRRKPRQSNGTLKRRLLR